jgi:hypothetical protein
MAALVRADTHRTPPTNALDHDARPIRYTIDMGEPN